MNKEELNEIINSYKWIKVKKHTPWVSGNEGLQYKELEEHHIEETKFLISKCRELASELLKIGYGGSHCVELYKTKVMCNNYFKYYNYHEFEEGSFYDARFFTYYGEERVHIYYNKEKFLSIDNMEDFHKIFIINENKIN